jgi:hypothetical protein
LSEEQLADLVSLDSSSFDGREHAALSWVRAFLTSPDGVPQEVTREFEAVFPPRERAYVRAAMKGMFCVNLAVNTQRYVLSRLLRRRSDYPIG